MFECSASAPLRKCDDNEFDPCVDRVATCADLAGLDGGQALQDCLGALLMPNTQVVTCEQLTLPTLVTGEWRFTNPDLHTYKEDAGTVNPAAGAIDLDASVAPTFSLTLTADVTLTFSGAPAAGSMRNLTVVAHQDGAGGWTITWPASVVWADGSAPVVTVDPGATDVFTFFTVDAGVTWYGFPAGQNFS